LPRVPVHLLLLFLVLLQTVHAAPNGQQLYQQHCSVCHNDNGMGGIGLPLSGTKVEYFPRSYLFKTIRHGRPGRVMPAFEALSDAQVSAIVDHVLGWRANPQEISFDPQPVSGDAARGKALFARHCADCHGAEGGSEGLGTGVTLSRKRKFDVIPPALNNPGFLASASDAWVRHTIVQGRPGTSMPSQQDLAISDQQVDDIVAHIRGFADAAPQQSELADNSPTLVFDSPYDFITTVNNLKQSLQGLNFRYFPDRYLEMGLAADDLINRKQLSLRFCNFQELYQVINIDPRLGVVLPCRVTVVETADGTVKIYAMNMQMVSKLYNNTQLEQSAQQMHEAILELIEEATL